MAHVDAAPVRAAQGLPGGAQDDRDMGDRERSGAIVEGGLVTKKWISDPISHTLPLHSQGLRLNVETLLRHTWLTLELNNC